MRRWSYLYATVKYQLMRINSSLYYGQMESVVLMSMAFVWKQTVKQTKLGMVDPFRPEQPDDSLQTRWSVACSGLHVDGFQKHEGR